jgi:bifunctional non-homologous end joining protein LigD
VTADARGPALAPDPRDVPVPTPDRVLWPATGTTKADLVEYLLAAAPALLPQVSGRPVTLHRFPEGVGGPHFFQTRVPPHPPWVRTATLAFPRTGKTFEVAVLDDAAGLVWAAGLSTLELHPYLAPADRLDSPAALVVDLDPGPPAGLLEACAVALDVRDVLVDLGLRPLVKTSGGKGVHVVVPLAPGHSYAQTKGVARALAGLLTERRPDRVVDRMDRRLRHGRVLVDWSQNDPGKSTVAAYSPRGGPAPTVSTPVRWDELAAAVERGEPGRLVFGLADALRRLDTHGDLFAAPDAQDQRLPALARG